MAAAIPASAIPSGTGAVMPPGMNPAALQSLQKALSDTRTVLACAAAVYVWDWLICLPQEYRLIWRARPNFLNVVFLLLRYLTFVEIALKNWLFTFPLDQHACSKAIWIDPIFTIVLFLLADYIVISRVYGMWERSKAVLAILCAWVVAQVVVHAYLARNMDGMIPPGIKACVPSLLAQKTRTYWIVWGMPMIFDVLVLVLSMYRLTKMWQSGGKSRLIHVLIRDQVVFYLLCLAVTIANILVYYVDMAPGSNGRGLMESVVNVIQSIAVCRVVLNVRDAAAAGKAAPSSSLSSSSWRGHLPFSARVQKHNISLELAENSVSSKPSTSDGKSAYQTPRPSEQDHDLDLPAP